MLPKVTLRNFTLIGSDGSANSLLSAGGPMDLGVNSQLHGVGPHSVRARRRANMAGEVKEGTQDLPRTFSVPLLINADTELEVDERLSVLGQVLDPDVENRLIYERPDGSRREIVATYLGGGDRITVEHRDKRFFRVPLVFRAHYPYWRDVAAAPVTSGPTTFLDGFTSLSNDVTMTNAGDVTTWPVITITGKTQNIEALNMGTGQVWRITEIIETGDVLRIDTDPRSFSVLLNDQLRYDVTDPIADFFPLLKGDNRIIIRGNSDSGVTAIGTFEFAWRHLYKTA